MMGRDTKEGKVLRAIYDLEKRRKSGKKITKEMIIVKSWEMFPSDFGLRGFPQYPAGNLVIRLLTNLGRDNFISGNVNNYKITQKGREFIEKGTIEQTKGKSNMTEFPRHIDRHVEFEINRILKSGVFEYFSTGQKDFLETDLFEFLGTSVRSFKNNRGDYLSRYNLVVEDVIPLCKDQKDEKFKIFELWNLLQDKFPNLLIK